MKKMAMKKLLLIGGALSMIAGVQAAQAAVVTYNVVETFYEPMTQPRNSIFTGSFTYDDVTQTVTNLTGTLTESMTGMGGGMMNELTLNYHLSSVYDATLGGLLVTTFLNNNTNTFTDNPAFGGTDGWAPGSGSSLYYNFGTANPNPGNAYAMIFVNTTDPTAPLTQAQIDKLAYADCSPLGMMSSTCMTGTTVAGYGTVGTMMGYPVSQEISAVPIPAAAVLMMSGLGMLGAIARRRRKTS